MPTQKQLKTTQKVGGKAPTTPAKSQAKAQGGKVPATPAKAPAKTQGGKAPTTPAKAPAKTRGGKAPVTSAKASGGGENVYSNILNYIKQLFVILRKYQIFAQNYDILNTQHYRT